MKKKIEKIVFHATQERRHISGRDAEIEYFFPPQPHTPKSMICFETESLINVQMRCEPSDIPNPLDV